MIASLLLVSSFLVGTLIPQQLSLNSLAVLDAVAISGNRATENKNPLNAVSNTVQLPAQANINTNNATTRLADFDNNTSFATSAKLIVIVEVVGGPLAPGDFSISILGNNVSPNRFQGQALPGTTVTLNEGYYAVQEITSARTPVPGYIQAWSVDCSGTMKPGDTKTCKLTYGYRKAVLYVTKEVFGGTLKPEDFHINIVGNNPLPETFPGGIRTPVLLDPGNYEVIDPNVPPGYVVSYSGFNSCKRNIQVGEYMQCFVWNDIIEESPKFQKDLGYESGGVTHGWEWGQAQYNDDSIDRLQQIEKSLIQPLSPDKEGNYILKATVEPQDNSRNHPTDPRPPDKGDGARAEVASTSLHFFQGEEYWYHWYTMFPIDLQIPSGPRGHEPFHIFTQVHQQAPSSQCRNPSNGGKLMICPVIPLGFNLANYESPHKYRQSDETKYVATGPTLEFAVINKTDVNTNENSGTDPQGNPTGWGFGDGGDTLWADKLVKGKWYEFLLHVKWATCAGNRPIEQKYSTTGKCLDNNGGFVELWVDGNLAVKRTDHFTLDDDGDGYLKQGLYHCKHDPALNNCQKPFEQTRPPYTTQSIFHDGMEAIRCPIYHPYYHPDIKKCHINKPPYS